MNITFYLVIFNKNKSILKLLEGVHFMNIIFVIYSSTFKTIWVSFTLLRMILACIRHTYNLILFSYCNDKLSWPIFSGTFYLMSLFSRMFLIVRSFWNWAISFGFIKFPRPLRRSGIVYDSLLPIDLMGHFAAFGPICVVGPLCGL